ncbi:C2 calcium-dependent domain-containing protein 4D-like [Acipenser oxyrinchus oxyrinchus]|uniref:C2 calcium-dependent domain-containing protein 4D-like n=1 Tax=Acipenser oxyrinchus oxyrinchus TaxID=40147 RepID=A0AAD8CJ09_ACIOX|nr:C2 calcium-dependent domain-containing protein 4D-like [Acipenser oxyrinchus oxyrinchus]
MFSSGLGLLSAGQRGAPHSKLSAYPNILTPDRIPEFFIPPKLLLLPPPTPCAPESSRGGAPNRPWSPAQRELVRSARRHVIQIESADSELGEGDGEERLAAASPALPAAPHLSLACLPESPHTRRRESLFHSPPTRRSPVGEFPPQVASPSSLYPPFSSPDSDPASSADSSPFSSPLLPARSPPPLCQARRSQRLFCRTLGSEELSRWSSPTDSGSSSEDSPVRRRRLGQAMLAPPPLFQLDFICCQERLTKESLLPLRKGREPGGELRLSAEFSGEQGRLRVRLVSGEGLYPPGFDSRLVSCCVAVRLDPGRLQRQRSNVVKRSREPIFNEDFFFEGLSRGELDRRSLRVKVVNKGAGMKRDALLGEGEVGLASILPP